MFRLRMKNKLVLLVMALISLSACSKQPKILIAGSGWGEIALVDKENKSIDWRHEIGQGAECNCVILTPDNRIAYSYRNGARLIDFNQEVIWDYKLEEPGEIHTVASLPQGGFMLAASGSPAKIIELDREGKQTSVITFDAASTDMHGQFRQIRKSRNGNYLVPLLSRAAVVELDRNGKEVKSYPVANAPFSVMELPSDNLIVSCGDGHYFVEIDRKSGKEIRKISQSDFSQKDIMHYVAQIVRLENENLLLCNWNGHFRPGEEKNVPHLIEFDSDCNIVWQLDDFSNIKRVSAVHYIEDGSKLQFNN